MLNIKSIMNVIKRIIGRIMHSLIGIHNNYVREQIKSQLKSCGRGVWIGNDNIMTPATISMGDYSKIGNRCVIQSTHGEIRIGISARLGDGVNIHGGNHVYNVPGNLICENPKPLGSDKPVILGNDLWIGANAIILAGVTIGDGSVVGAGSIVTKDIPPYSIAVGVPAKVVGRRFTDEQLAEHLKIMEKRFSEPVFKRKK